MNRYTIRNTQYTITLDNQYEIPDSWTFENCGCGPCSISNVLNNYGYNINPVEIFEIIIQHESSNINLSYLRPKGINYKGILFALNYIKKIKKIPIEIKNIKLNFDNPLSNYEDIVKELNQGNMAIIHVGPSKDKEYPKTFSNGGHYLVISNVDDQGNFYVINSNRIGDNQIAIPFCFDTIVKNMYGRKESFNFLFIKKQ